MYRIYMLRCFEAKMQCGLCGEYVYKAYFTQVYRNPDVYIYVKGFTVCIRCLFYIGITAIYSWEEFYCLCGVPIFT